jgi:hypothetical protein
VNFDSVLEWSLTVHGLIWELVLEPPMLEGAADVRVYHPHGFLPHPDQGLEPSSFVTLGLDAVNRRLGTQGDPWFETTRRLLETSICLFVGMSLATFRDRAIAPHLIAVGERVMPARPLGFWIFAGGSALSESERREVFEKGVVPLEMAMAEVPRFLLGICQMAAAGAAQA